MAMNAEEIAQAIDQPVHKVEAALKRLAAMGLVKTGDYEPSKDTSAVKEKKNQYGNMPKRPALMAKFKGDAGIYPVWGFDWLNGRVLIDRLGYAWVPIAKIALVETEPDPELEPLAETEAMPVPVLKGFKVWFGLLPGRDKVQVSTIVATKTKKRAMEILGVNPHVFNQHWIDSGNKIHLSVALVEPEAVFQASSIQGDDFIQMRDWKG